MSTFYGYLIEGLAFTLVWLWTAINTFVRVIKCQAHGTEFTPCLSYKWPGTNIPAETLFKLLLSLIGFLATIFDDGLSWTDADGNYRKMAAVMSMSIYGIFLVHSLIELLMWLGIPLVKDADYVSGALGCLWYAMATYYRAKDFMLSKQSVVTMVKTFPLYPLIVIGVSLLVEIQHKTSYWTQMVRVICYGLMATWNFQAAHILHSASTFPGREPSFWNLNSHTNTAFIGAAFGDHICLHVVFLIILYAATAVYLRLRHGLRA